MKPVNKILSILSAAIIMVSCTDKKVIPVVTPTPPVADLGWQFESTPVWEDDFNDGTGVPNQSKWSYDVGGDGWGNNELQYYTTENAGVVNGNLVIQAKKQTIEARQYTSSRLITRGKGDWKYGRFVVRAKLPRGRGTWPAIWLLPSDNAYGVWPASGEIDIMEHVGFDLNKIHCSLHCSSFNGARGNQKTSVMTVPDATSEFHDYRIDWTPYSIKGYIDDEQYFEYTNDNTGFTTWPYNKNFYLILNVAVGGNWGGAQGVDDTVFPASMEVDYVKVYKMIE